MSLDVLRGFDMFWIIGGAGMVVALVEMLGFPKSWVDGLALQMTHVKWDGFHFFDLIFPLFIFISGVAVPYSVLEKKGERSTGPKTSVPHNQTRTYFDLNWVEFQPFQISMGCHSIVPGPLVDRHQLPDWCQH